MVIPAHFKFLLGILDHLKFQLSSLLPLEIPSGHKPLVVIVDHLKFEGSYDANLFLFTFYMFFGIEKMKNPTRIKDFYIWS